MKKIIIFTLLVMFVIASSAYAVDWSKYESGRNNIRLEGYNGQTGYIEFQDGDGNINGYLWIDSQGVLRIGTPSVLDFTTTKLDEDSTLGVVVGSQTYQGVE